MASTLKNLSDHATDAIPDSGELSIGLVVSDYHHAITGALRDGALQTLRDHGVKQENIRTVIVPGAFELPGGAVMLNSAGKYDAIICLGCVIKGETPHNDYINQSVADALQRLTIDHGKPFIFGLLTPNDEAQARARAGGDLGNKGVECAIAALRMAHLRRDLRRPKGNLGFSRSL